MPDQTIGSLPSAEQVDAEDLFVLEQGGDAKKIPASLLKRFAGVAVSPDLAQNDETQPDYVKNRTHYTTYEEVQIISETEITVAAAEDGSIQATVGDYIFDGMHVGDEVITFIDGVEYRSKIVQFWIFPFWGNIGLLATDGTGDTGEPYLAGYNGSAIIFQFADETWAGTHTVSVKGFASTHHTLPYKFAPAKYAYETDLADGAIPFEDAAAMDVALNAGARVTVKLNGVTYSVLDMTVDTLQLEHNLLIANYSKLVHVTWETGPDADVIYTEEIGIADKTLILPSSTAGSTKRFQISVDDDGNISAAEVT